MRLNDFILDIQQRFPVQSNRELAGDVADAMTDANLKGTGTFTYEGNEHKITAQWKDGCYRGDCNPATCYTNWELDS